MTRAPGPLSDTTRSSVPLLRTPSTVIVPPRGWLDRYYMRDSDDNAVNEVDWLVGAALFVRYEAVQQVGNLDEDTFFMYSEEIDWCKRFRNAGWQIFYTPEAEVIHYDDLIASGSLARGRETGKLRIEGKDYPVQDGDVMLIRFNV